VVASSDKDRPEEPALDAEQRAPLRAHLRPALWRPGGREDIVPATITNEPREALYELVRNHLGGVDGIWIALEEGRHYAAAEPLGLEFAADFRLLADIGWAPEEDREPSC
jgi:hypothetical protein